MKKVMTDDERFKLYLANTLEMEEIEQAIIPGLSSLSEESHLAGKVKKEQPVLVILGNPPYSGSSANINDWTERLLKEDIDGAQSYYKVDGKPLGEKNPKWLQDDYVKFLRFAQWKIQTSGYGIVGMITNHSYLDNPTFRGMRQSLMKTFDEMYILDLHGNSLKKEITPDGGKDENVFDIRQGVAIVLFVRNKKLIESQIYQTDIYGLRKEKYDWLEKNEFKKENYSTIKPQSPYYFLIKRDTEKIKHYLNWIKINEIFPVNSVGIVTSRDKFVIDYKKNVLKNRITQLINPSQPDEVIAQAYNLKDKSNWTIQDARKQIRSLDNFESNIKELLYRPFDKRHIFYNQSMIERMRFDIMRHMLEKNIGLTVGRQGQVVGFEYLWNLAFISENIIDLNLFYRGGELLFPLYYYQNENKKDLFDQHETEKVPNISQEIISILSETFGKKPTPEEILYYIYAVLYSAIYRETYAEFLRVDFPRVPFTSNYGLFKTMGDLGIKLADLHLLKSPELDSPVAKYQGSGNNDRIDKITYKKDELRIYINKDKYFEGVTSEVWNYHIGGYQVLHKYLKDRKGRIMDVAPRYCRIVTALRKTIEIQKQIDEIYPEIEKTLVEF